MSRDDYSALLFLDIDGVCNSRRYFAEVGWELPPEAGRPPPIEDQRLHEIDPEVMKRVERICAETDGRVVITSSWRRLHIIGFINATLVKRGLGQGRIIGATPKNLPYDHENKLLRSTEIRAYLDAHTRFEGPMPFAIVDDDVDARIGFEDRFVRTTMDDGLTDVEADKLIEIMRRPL